ncbi:hypothetical protein RFI_07409, partial [Reticulomyxa filosa]
GKKKKKKKKKKVYLNLSYNELIGPMPQYLNNLSLSTQLQKLHARNNRLSGYVPYNFLQLERLLDIDLSYNPLLILDFSRLNYTLTELNQDTAEYLYFPVASFEHVWLTVGTNPNSFITFLSGITFHNLSLANSSSSFGINWQWNDTNPLCINHLDLSFNLFTGLFPCYSRCNTSVANEENPFFVYYDLSYNRITSTNIQCFDVDVDPRRYLNGLYLVQNREIYKNQRNCLEGVVFFYYYSSWAIDTDWTAYCEIMSQTCTSCGAKIPTPSPTKQPIGSGGTNETTSFFIKDWWLLIVMAVMLFLIGVSCYCGIQKRCQKQPEKKVRPKLSADGQRTKKVTSLSFLNDRNSSLLYGEY